MSSKSWRKGHIRPKRKKAEPEPYVSIIAHQADDRPKMTNQVTARNPDAPRVRGVVRGGLPGRKR